MFMDFPRTKKKNFPLYKGFSIFSIATVDDWRVLGKTLSLPVFHPETSKNPAREGGQIHPTTSNPVGFDRSNKKKCHHQPDKQKRDSYIYIYIYIYLFICL